MMNEQERFELDAENDGFTNDFQRALAVSHSRRAPSQRGQAEALVAAGFAVVVERRPEYCGITDAILGESLTIAGHFKTRAEASAHAEASHCDFGDSTFEVWPREVPFLPREVVTSDDLPF
jgi:hypothetical protein